MGIEALPHRWMKKAYENHTERGTIYDFGIKYLRKLHETFYNQNMHKIEAYSDKYVPNPFLYQYDLCIFIWNNYYKILKNEIAILRELNQEELADKLLEENCLYGMERYEFLFLAGEMRWPTTILKDGSMHGLFIRDPWAELRAQGVSDEYLKYLISFGGGGQGKTHFSIAFGLMMFDYHMFTLKGARCMISTVNEDKMNSAAFSYLCNLNSSTLPGISLSAGKAKISGGWTLTRPGNKDKAGVFKGILIGNQMNKQSIIDKLTGSHGHPFLCYIIDEAQSTPDPPITAAPNFTMHATDYRIILSGNYGENDDTLANNIEPPQSWDGVDEHTGQWISTTQNGSKAIVLHFNNNLSPGMTTEGARKWPHLPNKTKLDKQYPENRRNLNDLGYRRFWLGWRSDAKANYSVIYEELVKENKANLPLSLSRLLDTFYVFDSAQAEVDRNPVAVCQEGICRDTGKRVFGPVIGYSLNKSTESLKYYRESTEQLLKIIKKNNIKSGHAVHDWTGRPAHPELLADQGFQVEKLIYNKGLPDGKTKDKITNRVLRAIRVDVDDLDFKKDVHKQQWYAHYIAETSIGFAAWLLRQYISVGRVRGINEDLLKQFEGSRSIEKELYSRKYFLKPSNQYGDRFMLEDKMIFRKKFGFSPDVLDLLFQMAWYAFMVAKIPLTNSSSDDKLPEDRESFDNQFNDINNLYQEDGLYELDV
jgi:hypothetical protein